MFLHLEQNMLNSRRWRHLLTSFTIRLMWWHWENIETVCRRGGG